MQNKTSVKRMAKKDGQLAAEAKYNHLKNLIKKGGRRTQEYISFSNLSIICVFTVFSTSIVGLLKNVNLHSSSAEVHLNSTQTSTSFTTEYDVDLTNNETELMENQKYILNGLVSFVAEKGGAFEEELKDKGKLNFEGEIRYVGKNGDTYDGGWSNDSFNGYGKLTQPNVGQYEGYFLDGIAHGRGVITKFKNGQPFETFNGTHVRGRRDGLGIEDDAICTMQRVWRNGAPLPIGIKVYKDGRGLSYKGEINRTKGAVVFGTLTHASTGWKQTGQWIDGADGFMSHGVKRNAGSAFGDSYIYSEYNRAKLIGVSVMVSQAGYITYVELVEDKGWEAVRATPERIRQGAEILRRWKQAFEEYQQLVKSQV